MQRRARCGVCIKEQKGFAAITALITAGAGLVGDFMSQSGQQQTNAAQIANSQALQQESERWQTQMSDTSMQRRVADMRAAGLNPILAAGGPGAPMGSPVAPMPNLQNPNAAFQNTNGIASNAVQAAQQIAQIKNTEAQTKLTQAQTPGDVFVANDDGTPDFFRGNGGLLGNASVANLQMQVKQGNALVSKIQQDTKTSESQMDSYDINNALTGINVSILKQVKTWLVQQQIADAKIDIANVSPAEAMSKIYSGQKGAWIAGLEKAIQAAPMIGSAVGQAARGLLSGPAQITNIRR